MSNSPSKMNTQFDVFWTIQVLMPNSQFVQIDPENLPKAQREFIQESTDPAEVAEYLARIFKTKVSVERRFLATSVEENYA